MATTAAQTTGTAPTAPIATTSSPAPTTTLAAQTPPATASIITALGNAFKTENGEQPQNEYIAKLLNDNMGQLSDLAKQGKLNSQQIAQLKEFAEKHKGTKPGAARGLMLGQPAVNTNYTASSTLSTPSTQATPVAWPTATQGRPTLTGGTAAGRLASTPVQTKPGTDETFAPDETGARRKSTPGDASMRRSIQDLVASIDPNVKIEPEVEDLLLEIADEFIDSVTNFGCRLAKHRGGDTLEIKDLQLHLERNHNIRIPGFSTDETRISLSQTGASTVGPTVAGKKGAQTQPTTLRTTRIQQVQQAKREAKLM
ncbi:transcription initiation factor TFIID subunit A-domain-containing protein [Amylostereum chailletii]|nr:transcription initiation factor TFIID subunit A-domain-containing protein [Amylostereum chailletii]KAI0314289.1 transcription initiation factor TFIID subunit A-domain-containing protein [Amylostereum chailletii]